MRRLSDYPTLENHLRSINEILTSYQENQAIPRVFIFSHEMEGLISSSAFFDNRLQELIINGSLQIDGDGSLSDYYYPSIEGLALRDTPQAENSYVLEHDGDQINKNNLDRNNRILTDYDNIIGEFIITKKGKKEGLKIIDLLYSLGLKTDKRGSNGGHIHTSITKKDGLRKLNTPSFVNAFYDFHDLFTFQNDIKSVKGYLNRVNGNKTDFCNRGNNLIAQMEIYHSIAIGQTSYRAYPKERYYGLNATMEKTSRNSRKKFNTIENRVAPIFRSANLQHKYVSEYITFINKFLEFFKDVSSEDLTRNMIYKRVNQSKYLVNEGLKTAHCLSYDSYVNSDYGNSRNYVNFNELSSLGENETITKNREEFLI